VAEVEAKKGREALEAWMLDGAATQHAERHQVHARKCFEIASELLKEAHDADDLYAAKNLAKELETNPRMIAMPNAAAIAAKRAELEDRLGRASTATIACLAPGDACPMKAGTRNWLGSPPSLCRATETWRDRRKPRSGRTRRT
jgi:hypothetical protein